MTTSEFTIENYVNESSNFPSYNLIATINGVNVSVQEGTPKYEYYDGFIGLAVGSKTIPVYIKIPASTSSKVLKLSATSGGALSIRKDSIITSSIFKNGDAYNSITFG